jgi:CheY-like chemotaxis protein
VDSHGQFWGEFINMAQVNTHRADLSHVDIAGLPSTAVPAPRRGAVLVLEDRDDVRQGMAQLLELHGFLVVDASNAEEALGHLATDPQGFALILLDLMMPGRLSGNDFRARQLATPELAHIPTLVVSATCPDSALCSELHPDAWIEKPFRFDDLLAIVKHYVTPEAGALIVE